jgi:hypothetical protein
VASRYHRFLEREESLEALTAAAHVLEASFELWTADEGVMRGRRPIRYGLAQRLRDGDLIEAGDGGSHLHDREDVRVEGLEVATPACLVVEHERGHSLSNHLLLVMAVGKRRSNERRIGVVCIACLRLDQEHDLLVARMPFQVN